MQNVRCRGNRALGYVIPWLLAAFILSGWRYCTFTLGPLLYRRNPITAIAYLSTFNFLILHLFRLFMHLTWAPKNHSIPWEDIPDEIVRRAIPYECINIQGDLPQCWQDDCRGRRVSARSRHCKDCRVHRELFDHVSKALLVKQSRLTNDPG